MAHELIQVIASCGVHDDVPPRLTAPVSSPAGAPWVIAHRGDHREAAENSLAAFDAAIRSGCDLIETDLRRCRDGIVMVHDARAGGRPVSALTRREIREATGSLPPGLDDVVERCRGSIGLDLELKEAGLEAEVLDAVTPFFAPSQFLVSSFQAEILSTVRSLNASVRTGLLSARGLAPLLWSRGLDPEPDPAGEVLAAMRHCGADYLLPDALDHELITHAADSGTDLILWYANTADQIRAALSRPAVAGVITDRPDLMRSAPTLSRRAENCRGESKDAGQPRARPARAGWPPG